MLKQIAIGLWVTACPLSGIPTQAQETVGLVLTVRRVPVRSECCGLI